MALSYEIMPREILTEVSNMTIRDCLKVNERFKKQFDYPLHRHTECEFNFIQDGKGARRVIGDSIEYIDDLDLVLVTGENLEHVWEHGVCQSEKIREITIHFPQDLFPETLQAKDQFSSISEMLSQARLGVSFPRESILKVYHIIDSFTSENDSFFQFMDFLKMLYILSQGKYKVLASNTFAKTEHNKENVRIKKVREYIQANLQKEITLESAAQIVGMSPPSFSRFFKTSTGENFSSFLTETRLGHASRALVDTNKNISEIAFDSGFNNLSNFNRVFHARRGMTPKEFRQLYKKHKITI